MADSVMREILVSLNCEDLIVLFQEHDIDFEAYKLLQDSDIQKLSISIGKRVKLLNHIQKINSTSEIDTENTYVVRSEPPEENVKQNILTSRNEEKTVVRPNVRSYVHKRLCHNIDLFDLHNCLQQSCIGQGIIKEYENKDTLSNKSRNNLVSLIINNFLDKSIILTNSDIEILARKISALFPNEISETYYISPTKLSYGGITKACIARGKLIDKHRNLLRDFRKCGLLKTTKDSSKVKVNTDNAEYNDSCIWLKNNREPFTEVIEHWKKTYINREQSQAASIAEFIEEWPILSLPNGYVMIDDDFTHKYPDSSNSMYRKFDNLMNHILSHYLPKKSGGTGLKSLLDRLNEESISDDQKDLIKFLILPYVFPQNGLIKSKVKWRPSIAESQSAFISIVKIPGEIENLIEERKQFCRDKKITLQPFVLVVSDDVSLTSYVIIDDLKYQLLTVRKAVDICFKSFQVFNAKYPNECENIWYFLQKGVYEIETAYDYISPSVLTILNSLKVTQETD